MRLGLTLNFDASQRELHTVKPRAHPILPRVQPESNQSPTRVQPESNPVHHKIAEVDQAVDQYVDKVALTRLTNQVNGLTVVDGVDD